MSAMVGKSFWHRARVRRRNMVNRFDAGLTTIDDGYRWHILQLYSEKAWVLAQQIEAGKYPDGTEVPFTEADYERARDRWQSQAADYNRRPKKQRAAEATAS